MHLVFVPRESVSGSARWPGMSRENRGVSDAIGFDPGLYRGTARYYDRFRVPYPRLMLDDLVDRAGVSGRGRLLDLACGTGQIAFALADRFAEAWAVDQEPDMIEVVHDKARAAGASRVQGIVSRAEGLDAASGAFELVAIGNAFHRLAREAVAANAHCWLRPSGCIALLWAGSPWTGGAEWQRAMSAVLDRWKTSVGADARVPGDWNQARRERPDRSVLTAAGFQLVHSSHFPATYDWAIDTLIGFVYSTSFLPRHVLGDRAPAFERDLRRELAGVAGDNMLRETIDFAYELARRPA